MPSIEVRITHHDSTGAVRRLQVLPKPYVDAALMALDVARSAQEARGSRPVFIWDEDAQETVQVEARASLWVNDQCVPVDQGEIHTRRLGRALAEG